MALVANLKVEVDDASYIISLLSSRTTALAVELDKLNKQAENGEISIEELTEARKPVLEESTQLNEIFTKIVGQVQEQFSNFN